MKYLVMENHPGYSIVLDERGAFHRVANMGYEPGERVEDVVFMNDRPEAAGRTGARKTFATLAAACVLLVFASVVNVFMQSPDHIYMTINPSVTIEADRSGTVEEIEAANADGKELIEGYEYEGKKTRRVVRDLVDRAEEKGFISEGELISLEIETDDRDRSEEIAGALFDDLETHTGGIYSITITIDHEIYQTRSVVIPAETVPPSVPSTSPPQTEPQRRYTSPPAGDSGYSDDGNSNYSDDGNSGYDDGGGDSGYDD